MRSMADKGLNIQLIVDLANQFRGLVYNGDIVVFPGQISCNMETDLAGTTNDNLHFQAP